MEQNNGAIVGTIKQTGRKPVVIVDYSQLTAEQSEGMFSFAEPESPRRYRGKTSIKTGWCTEGLIIPPEKDWKCSECGKHVTTDDQESQGGWFDYDKAGELAFVHTDCCTSTTEKPEIT